MKFSRIVGTGSYLPEKTLTNDELQDRLNTSNEWIRARTGIETRRIANNNQNTSDLATLALEKALKNANLAANDIDAIVLATTTPDLIFPATAVRVQRNIKMKKGFAFDVQAVCSGFIYALQIADSLIKAEKVQRIAVIGAETMSRIVNWYDRSTCVLFGDGAGALILEKNESTNQGIIDIELFSDGEYQDMLIVNGGVSSGNFDEKVTMNGREVFRHAVTKIPESIENIIQKNNINLEELNWILLHQANQRIIKSVMSKLNVDVNKAISTVAHHANTSAASIPLALDEYVITKKIKTGDLIVLSALGAGFTWGAALIKI